MDVEVEAPHQHHHTGHKWLDKVLPVSALFVSLISILIAYHHGHVMQDLVRQNERLVAANSLPFLQLYSNTSPQKTELFIANAGIGPGEIKAAQVLVNGKPVKDIEGLLKECCGSPDRRGVAKSSVRGLMIRPGDSVKYVIVNAAEAPMINRRLRMLYDQRKIETRICYCSVFGECWTRSSFDSYQAISPRPVDSCPISETEYRS